MKEKLVRGFLAIVAIIVILIAAGLLFVASKITDSLEPKKLTPQQRMMQQIKRNPLFPNSFTGRL